MKKIGIGSIIYGYYNFCKYEIILESEQYYILRKIQNNENCPLEEDVVKKSCVNTDFLDIKKRLERERSKLRIKEIELKDLFG